MNQQRDIERLLDHWFSDGPTEAPDRVIDIGSPTGSNVSHSDTHGASNGGPIP